MRKLGVLWTVVATVALSVFFYSQDDQAIARPLYKKQFEKKYPEVKANNKVTCNACHVGKSKKDRNGYGKAITEALDAKNVKDGDKVDEALDAAAEAEDGKYGKLLKAGKLPVE